MTHQKISETSTDEIERTLAEHRARKGQCADVPCRWCGIVFRQQRYWQHFCCPKHQALWHQNEEKIYIEKLEGTIAALRRQIADLQGELIAVKRGRGLSPPSV